MNTSPSIQSAGQSRNRFNACRRWLCCAAILLLSTHLTQALLIAQEREANALERGKPTEHELAGGQSHSYRITLEVGQYLHAIVEQRGVDVVVTLFAPDGTKVLEVDSPNGEQGPEPVSVVTEAAGKYRLEIRSLEARAAPGRYRVEVVELRAATAQDRSRVAAQRAFNEAEQLNAQGTAESLRHSIEKYKEAIPLFRSLGDRSGEAAALTSVGLVYDALGEKQQALDCLSQALPLWRAIGDRGGEARTLTNTGTIYVSMGERQKALTYFNQALPLWQAIGNTNGVAATLTNTGFVHDALGEKQKALDYYRQALPLFHDTGNRGGESATLSNIAKVYDALGEKQKALDYFNQALVIQRLIADRRGEASTLVSMGATYHTLNEEQKALDYYKQAIPIFQAAGDRSGEAAALTNTGTVYDALGDIRKALDYYNEAVALWHALGERDGEASTLADIGAAHIALHERQLALEYYARALSIFRATGNRKGEASALSNIGLIYDELGETQKAIDHYNQALSLRRAVGDRGGTANTLYNIARLESNRNNLATSRARIEATLEIVESLRTKVVSGELRASYFALAQDYYEFYIGLLMRLHKEHPAQGYDAEALRANERAHARSLLELLAEARADITRGVDPAFLERERAVQQQLNAVAGDYERLRNSPPANGQAAARAGEVEALRREIESLTTRLQQVRTQIQVANPRYANLTQPQSSGLPEIQQMLDPDVVLLEYALGEEHSYLWVVTRASFKSYELPERVKVETAARSLIELVKVVGQKPQEEAKYHEWLGRVARAREDYPRAASLLSGMLLGQAAADIRGKRLLIVGEGVLQYVPFAALPEPAVGGASERPPLIAGHEILTLPSASTLAALRRRERRQTHTKEVVIFADPVYDVDDARVAEARRGKRDPSQEGAGTVLRSAAEVGLTEGGTCDACSRVAAKPTRLWPPRRPGARPACSGSRQAASVSWAMTCRTTASCISRPTGCSTASTLNSPAWCFRFLTGREKNRTGSCACTRYST